MNDIIYTNKQDFEQKLENMQKDGVEKMHILADFDRTLTKAFLDGKSRPSLISVLRSEWILWEDYSKKAYELFNYYHPIEIDTNISLEEKKKEMKTWWEKHMDLLVKTWLTQKDIEKAVELGKVEFRDGVIDFLNILKEKNIPLIIISANGLWADSIKLFLQQNNVDFDNIFVISNQFVWDENWYAIDYKKPIIHTFNKDETILKEFPKIYEKIKNRKNIILLWDSLWDHHMVEGFDYKNLIKIWFLNEKVEELLEEYKKRYDVIVTEDGSFKIVNEILRKINPWN